MNDSESSRRRRRRRRRPVLAPVSNRVLHHPSLQSLYAAADPYDHRSRELAQPISRAEIFYIDPTMYFGRIPNLVCEFEISNYFQLNTPPPVMSTCIVRSGLNPAGDLGQSEWTVNSAQPNGSIVHCPEEADQTMTNLLSLNHQQPQDESQRELLDLIPSDVPSEDLRPIFRDGGADVPSRRWSEEELEAAEALLSCFDLTEAEALTLLDDLVPLQGDEHGSQTGLRGCTFPSEIGDPGETGCRSEEVRGASMATERMLSDSECDAVCVLLSIRDVALLEGVHDQEAFGAKET